jgi:hypothetical protein
LALVDSVQQALLVGPFGIWLTCGGVLPAPGVGIADLFKRKPKRSPEFGIIESYNVADNIGEIRLAAGALLRFGKTACKGFEPAMGVKVHVVAVGPHPRGGQRAESVVLDPEDTEYAKRVAARDSQAAPAAPLPELPPLLKRPIDVELLRRLGNIGAVNVLVRGGHDPAQLYLAVNVNREGVVEESRPAVGFRFDVERIASEHWRIVARIDEPTTSCRFWLDLNLPEIPALDPASFDMSNSPGFRMVVSKAPECEREPLTRSGFLLAWRVEGGMEESSLDSSLHVDAAVMGVELTRMPHAYGLTGAEEHWVLLKCSRRDECFFIGLDLSTGAGEVFPRRYDVNSYRLALDFLRTFT